MVSEFAMQNEVSPRLAACIVQHESAWNPKLISADEDTGLFQIIPDTAAWAAMKLGYAKWDMTDPVQNAEFGTFILKYYPEWYMTLDLCQGD